MKLSKTISAIVFSIIASSASAQSPREQLAQLVEQFGKTPTDTALQVQIITLGAKILPPPALTEETERRMARGRAAFKGATSIADYNAAASEFQLAVIGAPWYGDAYYNLGVAQDKAERFNAALRSLRRAQIASPDAGDIRTLIFEVEYRRDKANSPEVRAAKAKEAEQRFIASLEGAKYFCPEILGDDGMKRRIELDVKNGKMDGANVVTWINPGMRRGVDYASNVFVGFRGMWWKGETLPLQGKVSVKRMEDDYVRIEILADQLNMFREMKYGNQTSWTVYPAETCRRAN